MYFLAHLRLKGDANFTGPETMIARQCESLDSSWMPQKKSWAIQVAGDLDEAGGLDEDPTLAAIREGNAAQAQQLAKVKAQLNARLEGAVNKLSGEVEELGRNLDQLRERLPAGDGEDGDPLPSDDISLSQF